MRSQDFTYTLTMMGAHLKSASSGSKGNTENQSFFPFQLSSQGIQCHSLATHSQSGELSTNVHLAAFAGAFVQFTSNWATGFSGQKRRRSREGWFPVPGTGSSPGGGGHCPSSATVQIVQRVFETVESFSSAVWFCSVMCKNAAGSREGAASVF